MFRKHCLPLVLSCTLMSVGTAHCAEVIAHAQVVVSGGKKASNTGVVVWLQPPYLVSAAKPSHFRLVQKDKKFTPHLLVIPLGSTVDFPNLDPFFHNVFSQFNGKRFDLGLYEAGSTKAVRFDHEGVSYLLQYPPGDERRCHCIGNTLCCRIRSRRECGHTQCSRGRLRTACLGRRC